jgi:hypothetical protein
MRWLPILVATLGMAAAAEAQTQQAPAAPPSQAAQPAAPAKPGGPPVEKPPRVADYYWFEGETRDGFALIGFGHPKRQPGGEYVMGFGCKVGSGDVTFVIYETGREFSPGQRVIISLEIDKIKSPIDGLIELNEWTSFPMATGTVAADDALQVLDDTKVLRVEVDGWSAAAPLILISEVAPDFLKACSKKMG